MTQLSATYPANQWVASEFHIAVEASAVEIAACVGSTNLETHKEIVLKGITMLLPAGNA